MKFMKSGRFNDDGFGKTDAIKEEESGIRRVGYKCLMLFRPLELSAELSPVYTSVRFRNLERYMRPVSLPRGDTFLRWFSDETSFNFEAPCYVTFFPGASSLITSLHLNIVKKALRTFASPDAVKRCQMCYHDLGIICSFSIKVVVPGPPRT